MVIPKAARGPGQLAMQFIAAIGELYAVESRAREKTADARLRLREEFSRPVLRKIEGLLLTHLHAVVPGSLLGKALHYLSSQWPKLVRYVEHGAWPIDNNFCENAIRPFVVGRRNWLFSDTVGGAHASANLYSLIETWKAIQIVGSVNCCRIAGYPRFLPKSQINLGSPGAYNFPLCHWAIGRRGNPHSPDLLVRGGGASGWIEGRKSALLL